jgi:uncharacterized protein
VSARDLYTQALAPFAAEARALLPAGAEVFDAHTHLGLDEDGRSLDLPSLLAQLDDAGARRACVFALHDPERRPAYSVPNDRVLGWAAESEGRLIPFCRLDPAEAPVAEAERCLSKGARGIKLHPRAQAFTFESPEMEGVFALAEEARVPILIHAGRGMPPIADALATLALRHPEAVLILAHGAICDQGILTTRLANHPGVLYDTSCFFPIDVLQLFARVPAERIVFASDPPYGLSASGLYLQLRVAAHIGLDEHATRAVVGATMARLVDGHGLPPASAPAGPQQIVLQGRLARVYGYGSLAGPALFAGATEQAQGMLDLAIAACRDPDPGDSGEALQAIGAALTAARALLAVPEAARGAIDLLFRAMARAATEPAGGQDGAGEGDGRLASAQLTRD